MRNLIKLFLILGFIGLSGCLPFNTKPTLLSLNTEWNLDKISLSDNVIDFYYPKGRYKSEDKKLKLTRIKKIGDIQHIGFYSYEKYFEELDYSDFSSLKEYNLYGISTSSDASIVLTPPLEVEAE